MLLEVFSRLSPVRRILVYLCILNLTHFLPAVGGQAVTIVTSVGGQAITLAGSAGGVATSFGGSVYSVATGAAGSAASNVVHSSNAAVGAPSFGFTSSHAIGLATVVCSALVGAMITL